MKSMISKIYKVEIETLQSDIEGKELISSHTDEWYFDSFENAVWCADHPGIETDFWTKTKSRIFEYEICNMREIHKKSIAVEFATKIEQHWIRDEE